MAKSDVWIGAITPLGRQAFRVMTDGVWTTWIELAARHITLTGSLDAITAFALWVDEPQAKERPDGSKMMRCPDGEVQRNEFRLRYDAPKAMTPRIVDVAELFIVIDPLHMALVQRLDRHMALLRDLGTRDFARCDSDKRAEWNRSGL